jgi:DNA-binding CsgD family transcriptional regulator
MMMYDSLSRRERQIALWVATGASNKEIARELGVSIKTVKNILTKAFAKTGARSRADLALQIVRLRMDKDSAGIGISEEISRIG